MKPSTRFAALLLLSVLPAFAAAQLVTGRFSTALYSWEKFDSTDGSTTYLRAFQNVQLNIAQGDVSLHTYLQGALNTNTPFGGSGYLRVFNLYLRWARIFKALDLSVGRQTIFGGVGNGTIDGAQGTLRLFREKVSLSLYGGGLVRPELTWPNWSDYKYDYLFGGRLLVRPVSSLQVGLSYMNRHEQRDPYWTVRARDTMFTAVPYYVTSYTDAAQIASADVSYLWGTRLSLYGRFDYDMHQEQTSRAELNARVGVTDRFAVLGTYIHRVPRIDFNSIFWVFPVMSVDELEGGVEYAFTPALRGFARIADVAYTDDRSHRWTIGLNALYGSISYAGSDGYAGQLQSLNLQAVYPIAENTVIPSAAFSVTSYRLSAEEEDRDLALSLALGGTVRTSKSFSFDVQWQLMHNKIYATDSRIFVKLNYWFAERLPFFGGEGK
jgi:hypothetical protein